MDSKIKNIFFSWVPIGALWKKWKWSQREEEESLYGSAKKSNGEEKSNIWLPTPNFKFLGFEFLGEEKEGREKKPLTNVNKKYKG